MSQIDLIASRIKIMTAAMTVNKRHADRASFLAVNCRGFLARKARARYQMQATVLYFQNVSLVAGIFTAHTHMRHIKLAKAMKRAVKQVKEDPNASFL